jgi:hypothetical protein
MTKYEVTMPECYNLICPCCNLTWMVPVKEQRYYVCLACTFILFDRQVEEIVKQKQL